MHPQKPCHHHGQYYSGGATLAIAWRWS
jgi:hypothetical protein